MKNKILPTGYIKVDLDYAPKDEKDFEKWCEEHNFDYLGSQSGRRAWCGDLQTYFRGASGVAYNDGEAFLFYEEDIIKTDTMTICGRSLDEVVTILRGLEVERITGITLTMENMAKLLDFYRREQEKIVKRQMSRLMKGVDNANS